MQIKIGRDKFFDLMREHRMLIQRKKRFHKTTNSNHRFRKHPNLIKGNIYNKSEYDSDNDFMYVFTKLDSNKNGQQDKREPTHIFWIDLQDPNNTGRQY
jgi:hypothetical protein